MASVCFQVIAHNSAEFLEAALESVAPFGPIVAAEGPDRHSIESGYGERTDATGRILARYCRAWVSDTWHDKDDMQAAVGRLTPPGTTHVWVVDADEVWPQETLAAVISVLDGYDSASFQFNSFWCGFDHIMGGMEERYGVRRIQRWHDGATWKTHRPPTVLAPDGQPYHLKRHLSEDEADAHGWRCFHYSNCLPMQTLRKWKYYEARSPDAYIHDWFNRVYLPWAHGTPAERAAIETAYQGVHNWLPRVRLHNVGDATSYTRRYYGSHPAAIERRIDSYRARFEAELKEVTAA